MWSPALLAEVAAHTAPGGSFATYTAAGHVRAALQQAGFTVERRPGFGRKRHMTAGWLP
jgi:tRNA U34 5-methylaminomethyl-2-thiouridine-forming methyltransferase MnmC